MTANVEKIRRMQHIWDTQIKPFVVDLIEKEDGQYAAMALVAHACEHAYKAICRRRGGMQEALESVLRLHDFLPDDPSDQSVTTEGTKHWGRTDAHKIRIFIVNSWKHEGELKGEKTELINSPHEIFIAHSVTVSGLRDVTPLEIDDLKMRFDAHHFVKKLVSGVDSAYALFWMSLLHRSIRSGSRLHNAAEVDGAKSARKSCPHVSDVKRN